MLNADFLLFLMTSCAIGERGDTALGTGRSYSIGGEEAPAIVAI